MLNNLTGWHVLIILAVVVAVAVVALLIVVVALRLGRGSSRAGQPDAGTDPVAALQALAGLRDQGLLSDTEYEAKRQELLGRI